MIEQYVLVFRFLSVYSSRNTFEVVLPLSKEDKQFDEERLSGESVGATRTVQNSSFNNVRNPEVCAKSTSAKDEI